MTKPAKRAAHAAAALIALFLAGSPGSSLAAGPDLSSSTYAATPYTLSATCDLTKLAVLNVTLRNSGDATTDSISLKALDMTKELSGEMTVAPIGAAGVRDVQFPLRASTTPSAGAHVITVFFAPLRAMKPLVVQVPANVCPRTANDVGDSASARATKLRAALTSPGRPLTQHFTVPSWLGPGPSEWIASRPSAGIAAIKAEVDYQRKCDAGDITTPARIDRVRGPVSPGIIVQIAGECFGSRGGKVELVGLPSGPVRLGIQSWGKVAISATVPGVRSAGHQTVVLAVTPNYPATEEPQSLPRPGTEEVNAHGRAGATPAPARQKATPPAYAENINAHAAVRAGVVPRTNEATLEFWPEVERRSGTLVNRSCAYHYCINPGDGDPVLSGMHICKYSCGDHTAWAAPAQFSRLPDGRQWFHSGDDVWVIAHPAGWVVESVHVDTHFGTDYSATPRELGALQTLLTIHWQDSREDGPYTYNGGPAWDFIAYYDVSATMVGPKGTWTP